jgi:ferredoxin
MVKLINKACSTCHVYVDNKYFDKLPEPKEE